MKMKAPEGTTSAAVGDTQYEVDDEGHIEVENGEHIADLERHGFVQGEGELSHSDPIDEIGACPDFARFVNRGALVDWLTAHGHEGASAEDDRQDLEALCVEHFGRVAEGHAARVEPEAQEPVEDEQTEETDPPEDEQTEETDPPEDEQVDEEPAAEADEAE